MTQREQATENEYKELKSFFNKNTYPTSRSKAMSQSISIEPELTLIDLSSQIKQELHSAQQSARNAVEHAANVGELLLKAKKQINHGQWLSWLQDNFELSERTARAYMQLVNKCNTLQLNTAAITHLPLKQVLNVIADNEPKRQRAANLTDDNECPIAERVDASPEQSLDNLENGHVADLNPGEIQLGDFESLQAINETAKSVPDLKLVISIADDLITRTVKIKSNAEKALNIFLGKPTLNVPPPPSDEELESMIDHSENCSAEDYRKMTEGY